VVREQIKNFASTKKIFSSGFKLIILDEADMMTQTAQNALRRGKHGMEHQSHGRSQLKRGNVRICSYTDFFIFVRYLEYR
jgi:hypothetical protein